VTLIRNSANYSYYLHDHLQDLDTDKELREAARMIEKIYFNEGFVYSRKKDRLMNKKKIMQ